MKKTSKNTDSKLKTKTSEPINVIDRKPKPKGTRRRMSAKRIVLSLGFIVVITVAGTLLVNLFSSNGNGSASNQIRSAFSGEELKEYSSPENKFSILMPGLPTISRTSSKSGDKQIPITTYERVVDKGSKNYTVAAYDYTGVKLDEKKQLESSLNNALQNTPGAKITSTKADKYSTYNSIEAAYTVTEKDKVYESHIRYVINGSRMYAMILIGSDQATFDTFSNSLRLN